MIIGFRQYQILKLLMAGPPHGMTSGEFTSLPILRNTVHSTLVQMEKKGFVESTWTDSEKKRGGKRKRIFQISSDGRIAHGAFVYENGV